jgi:hypothetical protein
VWCAFTSTPSITAHHLSGAVIGGDAVYCWIIPHGMYVRSSVHDGPLWLSSATKATKATKAKTWTLINTHRKTSVFYVLVPSHLIKVLVN